MFNYKLSENFRAVWLSNDSAQQTASGRPNQEMADWKFSLGFGLAKKPTEPECLNAMMCKYNELIAY